MPQLIIGFFSCRFLSGFPLCSMNHESSFHQTRGKPMNLFDPLPWSPSQLTNFLSMYLCIKGPDHLGHARFMKKQKSLKRQDEKFDDIERHRELFTLKKSKCFNLFITQAQIYYASVLRLDHCKYSFTPSSQNV